MKLRPLARAIGALLALPLAGLRAELFPWPEHGTVTVIAPVGWKIENRSDAESFNLQVTPRSAAAAVMQLTLLTPADLPPMSKTLIQGQLISGTQQYVAASVEKKLDLKPLALAQGYGWYAQFTDASLVGKPPIPGNFKMLRTAMAALDTQTVALATLNFDDPQAPEVEAMQSILNSLRFTAGAPAPAALNLKPVQGFYELTVPESRLRLKIPAGQLKADTPRIGGGTDSPRYFQLRAAEPNLIISGWFEPSERFKDVRSLWESDVAKMTEGGLPRPVNVEFLSAEPWQLVSYEVPVDQVGVHSIHLRAELTRAGTWVDLHLSTTSKLAPADARAQLLAALAKIQVDEKR